MKNLMSVLFVSIVFAGCGQIDSNNSSSDLDEYIAQVRSDRMSEGAKGSLGSVASIHLGHSTLEYVRNEESSKYWASYRSNSCPSPTATVEEQKLQHDKLQAQMNTIMPAIIAAADTDSSGFVSTSEAQWFRKIYEFGHEYEFVRRVLGGDWTQYGGNSDMTASDLAKWVEEYNKSAEKAASGGVSLMQAIELRDNI